MARVSFWRSEHRFIYLGSALLLVALLVAGLIGFGQAGTSVSANDKANRLATQLEAAGYPVPDHGVIVRTLGTDGGLLCTDPGNTLVVSQAKIALSNGAGGPGQRPVISDDVAINAAELAVSVYCPDQLGAFKKAYGNLKYADTVDS
jgi:hypothetical protein